MKRDITKVMVAEIRHQQARALIKYAITTKTYLMYIPFAQALGMFSGSAEFNEILGEIMEEDHAQGAPLSCAVIVGSHKGTPTRPGKGFFAKALALGYQFPNGEDQFWKSQATLLGMT